MIERRTLDEWKSILIGNTYNMLTILYVLLINNKFQCLCKCECSNTLYVSPSGKVSGGLTVLDVKEILKKSFGGIRSCGCRSSVSKHINLEELKSKFVGKVINWLT